MIYISLLEFDEVNVEVKEEEGYEYMDELICEGLLERLEVINDNVIKGLLNGEWEMYIVNEEMFNDVNFWNLL